MCKFINSFNKCGCIKHYDINLQGERADKLELKNTLPDCCHCAVPEGHW